MQKGLGNLRARILGRLRAVHGEQQPDLVFTPEAPPAFLVFFLHRRHRGRGRRSRRGRHVPVRRWGQLRHRRSGGYDCRRHQRGVRRRFGGGGRRCAIRAVRPLENLHAATIDEDSGDRRCRHPRRRGLALDQRQCLVGGDRRIPFGNALVADPQAHPAHLLVGHVAFGQLVEVVFGLLVGRVVAARVRDLGQHGVAVVRPIKAETLGLREKKPADSDGSNVWVLAIGRRHPAFPRCVARGAFPDRVAWVGRNRRTFGIRGAVPRPACAPGVPGRCRASSRTGRCESRPRGLRVASASYPTRAPWVPRGGRRGF